MKVLKELLSWVMYIIIAFVIAALFNVFIFQITRVQGSSMVPTLKNNDLYVISKIGAVFNTCPDHENIVVIDSRTNRIRTMSDDFYDIFKYNVITTFFTHNIEDIYWVKRVIGLPGDTIKITGGHVYRNGEMLNETYVNPAEAPSYFDTETKVPEGYLWVMGDNRNHSTDSRYIGCVPIENVIGTLKFKIKSGS